MHQVLTLVKYYIVLSISEVFVTLRQHQYAYARRVIDFVHFETYNSIDIVQQ